MLTFNGVQEFGASILVMSILLDDGFAFPEKGTLSDCIRMKKDDVIVSFGPAQDGAAIITGTPESINEKASVGVSLIEAINSMEDGPVKDLLVQNLDQNAFLLDAASRMAMNGLIPFESNYLDEIEGENYSLLMRSRQLRYDEDEDNPLIKLDCVMFDDEGSPEVILELPLLWKLEKPKAEFNQYWFMRKVFHCFAVKEAQKVNTKYETVAWF